MASNSFNTEAIREEIERFDRIKGAMKAIREEVQLVPDVELRESLVEKLRHLEGVVLQSSDWTGTKTSVPDYKVCVLGATGSGKATWIDRLISGAFHEKVSTTETRFRTTVNVKKTDYKACHPLPSSHPSSFSRLLPPLASIRLLLAACR